MRRAFGSSAPLALPMAFLALRFLAVATEAARTVFLLNFTMQEGHFPVSGSVLPAMPRRLALNRCVACRSPTARASS